MLNIFKKNNKDDHKEISLSKLNEIVKCFSIGQKVNFFAEYQKDQVMETIIIAYAVNDEFIYSMNDIDLESDDDNDELSLSIKIEGTWKEVETVDSFSFVIPNQTSQSAKIDYQTMADIGRDCGNFKRGNSVSIIAQNFNEGIPEIESFVKRSFKLKDSVYKNHHVVVLEVDPPTFSFVEQRLHLRISTKIPAVLQYSMENEPLLCTILDFTEASLRISFPEDSDLITSLKEQDTVILTIPLEHQDKTLVLEGFVFRKRAQEIVLTLSKIIKDARFLDISLIDSLDIKASLLQHPNTR